MIWIRELAREWAPSAPLLHSKSTQNSAWYDGSLFSNSLAFRDGMARASIIHSEFRLGSTDGPIFKRSRNFRDDPIWFFLSAWSTLQTHIPIRTEVVSVCIGKAGQGVIKHPPLSNGLICIRMWNPTQNEILSFFFNFFDSLYVIIPPLVIRSVVAYLLSRFLSPSSLIFYLLPTTYYLLPTIYYLLSTTYYLLLLRLRYCMYWWRVRSRCTTTAMGREL